MVTKSIMPNFHWSLYHYLYFIEVSTCIDFPGFQDKERRTCYRSKYSDNLCKDGKPFSQGPYAKAIFDRYANSDGFSALDACCVCGGGIQKSKYL